jgi:hypothetical protein
MKALMQDFQDFYCGPDQHYQVAREQKAAQHKAVLD